MASTASAMPLDSAPTRTSRSLEYAAREAFLRLATSRILHAVRRPSIGSCVVVEDVLCATNPVLRTAAHSSSI